MRHSPHLNVGAGRQPLVTIIVPTRNRQASLSDTLTGLRAQDLPPTAYEIVVVDDGSSPAVSLRVEAAGANCTLVRLEGVERSAARNAGAEAAKGHLLVFVDDDMSVRSDFVRLHLDAQAGWPNAMVVGAVRLPADLTATPFGRFRQALEDRGLPAARGWVAERNFCTACNVSIPAATFRRLGGFDRSLTSSEDQDLALRHCAAGGRIAFLPEAEAIHRDSAVDIRSYCRRTEWGSEQMVPFCLRYPDWPDNVERARINGRLNWRNEPIARNLRRLPKAIVAAGPMVEALFRATESLERHWPREALLHRLYRLLLGAHIFRGYRRGLRGAIHAAPPGPILGTDAPGGRE